MNAYKINMKTMKTLIVTVTLLAALVLAACVQPADTTTAYTVSFEAEAERPRPPAKP